MFTDIPDQLKVLIKGENFNLNQGVNDLLIWGDNANGIYTTSSGFKWLLKQRTNLARGPSWNWIWRLPAPENIKFFFWLVFHNSVPTLSVLHHRGISPTAICRICQREDETLLHCIRDCPGVKRIWNRLGFIDGNFHHQSDAHIWLKQGATGPKDKLFIACVWWSWRARNAKCFNDETILFPRLLLSVLNLSETLNVCFNSEISKPQDVRQISWLQLNREETILNVDGSSLGNPGPAGFGGLARNPDGGWLFGFSGHIGISDVLKAELLGIFNGLKLAWERGIRNLICYTDSLIARKLITEQTEIFHRYASIIQDIKDQMILPWRIDLRHTLREGNQSADHLAKLGANTVEQLQIFEKPPLDLCSHLDGDAAGISFPRGYPRLVRPM